MTPSASPRKRPRRSANSPSTPRDAPGPSPVLPWPSRARQFHDNIFNMYHTFARIEPVGAGPDEILYRYSKLRLTFTDFISDIDKACAAIVTNFPELASRCSVFGQEVQTDEQPIPPPTEPEPTETNDPPPTEPIETEPTEVGLPPVPLPRTYAQAATPHTPQQPRQPRRQYKHPTAKKSDVSTVSNPTRLIANLHDQPLLSARELSPTELHRRITEVVSRVPNTPSLLGVKWNQKGNLILSYPNGSPRSAIRSHFPAIRSVLGSQSKIEFRFDVPWRRVHLANIWAREGPTGSIASEEELRGTLHLNPTIQALNITVQASWLKKPDLINGTHTSAVIAFEDPDGSIERSLLKSTIFAFGEVITVKKWYDKPRSKSY